MGGRENIIGNIMNDAFVLDTRTLQIEKVLAQQTASMQMISIESLNNASVKAADNVVVALVTGDDREPYLIQYALGTDSLSIVQSSFP